MASQVFYRRWRPQTLADVVGQEQATKTLQNALSSSHVSHAYLFCGPRGTGKTSTGRILAKAVNCLTTEGKGEPCNTCEMCQAVTEGRALDVIEIDAASNTGVDNIRDLRERVNYAPNEARYKVYIIDEVHMLSTSASNALLKTLEEPPPHAIFILATTEIHKVLPTIMSRCQRFDFRRISQADVVTKLTHISRKETIKIEPEALRLIARAATGSLRDAENLLEQLTTYYGKKVTLQQVQTTLGITGDWRAKEMVKHIVDNDIARGISTLNSVSSDGLDLRQFTRELVEYLRALLLVKTGTAESIDLPAEDIAELKELASKASLPQILKAVKLFGQLDLSLDNYSTLPLELALVDATLPFSKEPPMTKTEPEVRQPVKTAAPETPPPPPRKAAATEEQPQRPVAVEKKGGPEPAPAPIPEPAGEKIEPEPSPVPEPEAKSEPEPEPELAPVPEPGAKKEAPEPAPAPAEAVSTISTEAGGEEIEHLKQHWRRFIQEAPPSLSRTPAAALLRSARPRSVENNTVILSFKFPLHKESMEKTENQKIAEQIISNFLGHACRVRCVYEPEANHLIEEALKIGAQIIESEEK
ncbi:MAG: DNA polymerase III subunit gamma/tau [Dehalococcoidia bacterium]|nr:DNA polymerase III subunit gamma/tau [Dehalococcoidia bacterium]